MGLPSGLKWAPMNVDALQERGFAKSPFQCDCSFVSWGNILPHNPINEEQFDYDWGGTNAEAPWYENQPYGLTPGSHLETDIDITHDFAHQICGGKWRMPTTAEFNELFDYCDFVQADGTTVIDAGTADKRVTVNGVLGIYLKSKINGNLLFFACTGYGSGTSLNSRGSFGSYWSASFLSDRNASRLLILSGGVNPHNENSRSTGFAVRPVYDESLVTRHDGNSTGGGGSNSDTLAAPIISGNTSFSSSTQVTITAAEGATIKYTTDGSTPTSSSSTYSAALTINATTTVKAIAIKNGVTSEVASKVFTKSSGDDNMGQD